MLEKILFCFLFSRAISWFILKFFERRVIKIISFCYHEILSVVVNRRMCLVEVEGVEKVYVKKRAVEDKFCRPSIKNVNILLMVLIIVFSFFNVSSCESTNGIVHIPNYSHLIFTLLQIFIFFFGVVAILFLIFFVLGNLGNKYKYVILHKIISILHLKLGVNVLLIPVAISGFNKNEKLFLAEKCLFFSLGTKISFLVIKFKYLEVFPVKDFFLIQHTNTNLALLFFSISMFFYMKVFLDFFIEKKIVQHMTCIRYYVSFFCCLKLFIALVL